MSAAPSQATTSDGGRQGAHDALDRVMKLQSSLDAKSVEIWAGETYAAAVELVAEGDDLLARGDFPSASASYHDAASQLEALVEESKNIVARELERGNRALAAGDSTAATAAFRLAAAIDPDNATIGQGLRRSQVLDQVVALLDEGRIAEQNGDLQRAADAFRRAATLDPQSHSARTALTSMSSRIESDAFTVAMTHGLAALDLEDFAAAHDAFRRAAQVRPGSTESAEGIARAKEGLRLQAIDEHGRRAAAFEAEERWQAAAVEYDKTLAIDSTLTFALGGRARALERAGLAERIEFHLDNPDRMATEAVREEASELLAEAKAVSPAGPVLSSQIARLENLVRLASSPVAVELASDGLTDVVINRVGRLGRFTRHTLELHPGTYTVVGTREGFRDVRLRLVVKPGQQGEPLLIRCEEEI